MEKFRKLMTAGANSICTLLLQSGWELANHGRRQREILGGLGGRAEQDEEMTVMQERQSHLEKGDKRADILPCIDSLLYCTDPSLCVQGVGDTVGTAGEP